MKYSKSLQDSGNDQNNVPVVDLFSTTLHDCGQKDLSNTSATFCSRVQCIYLLVGTMFSVEATIQNLKMFLMTQFLLRVVW